jgi:acetoin utilization deacetylase AcuC-like enzyme
VRYIVLAVSPPATARARSAAPVQADHGLLGNILHLPLPAGSGTYTYLKRLREEAIPFLLGHREGDDWAPDFLLICAGAPVDLLKC